MSLPRVNSDVEARLKTKKSLARDSEPAHIIAGPAPTSPVCVEEIKLFAQDARIVSHTHGHHVCVGLTAELVDEHRGSPLQTVRQRFGIGEEHAFANDHLVAFQIGVVSDLQFTAVGRAGIQVGRVTADARLKPPVPSIIFLEERRVRFRAEGGR